MAFSLLPAGTGINLRRYAAMKAQTAAFVRFALGALLWTLFIARGRADPSKVSLIRAPDGGIQPQAGVDAKGVVHLIYFKGEPQGGDIFYVRRKPGEEAFSPLIRVNRQAGSAICLPGSFSGVLKPAM